MKYFSLTLGALLLMVCVTSVWLHETRSAKAAAPPSVDTKTLSPLEEQLISYEKAIPEAQKKHDINFYKLTLADDFVAV